ncbi:glucose-1-phosphate cytidylyltransferase [Candidatus Pelagibacter ubique]|nr:glucose-1-phosphate cytidylyltransferase [Candidatus Pelagibacter ubique]
MKVVILAGGKGTRIQEESLIKPKPLIEIGSKPIIWHIMKTYSHYGFKEFVICCGYKGYLIKEYFANFSLHNSDVTIDIKKNEIKVHKNNNEDWKITLIDTGDDSLTGGRILRIKDFVGEEFLLTYGDGVADVNISKLIEHHKINKKIATMTVVQPQGRFGVVEFNTKNNLIENFSEKLKGDGAWINGGFFVLNKKIFDYLKDDFTIWEKEPLEKLSKENQLVAFKHDNFWYPMDTMRDKDYLENLWEKNEAPWKLWNE